MRLVIRLWDRVHRGDIKRLGELRQLMDSFGITPKGQMDRRWERPKPPRPAWTSQPGARYAHLRNPSDPRYRPSVKERFAAIEGRERESATDRFLRSEDEERRRRLAILES